MNEYSFFKGWCQIRQQDVAEMRVKLMKAVGVTTRVGFLRRMKGEIEPKVSEHKKITEIFNKYGIKDIWGD